MSRLWDAERDPGSPVLRVDTLTQRLGGPATIVNEHLAAAMRRLEREQVGEATRLAGAAFGNLVTESGSKFALTAGELANAIREPEAEGAIAAALDVLCRPENRILRKVESAAGPDAARYELSHDVRGGGAQGWAAEEERRRLARARFRARRRAMVFAGLAAFMAALLVVSLVAYAQLRDEKAATRSRQLASEAEATVDRDPVSLTGALEGPSPDARGRAGAAPGGARATPAPRGHPAQGRQRRLVGRAREPPPDRRRQRPDPVRAAQSPGSAPADEGGDLFRIRLGRRTAALVSEAPGSGISRPAGRRRRAAGPRPGCSCRRGPARTGWRWPREASGALRRGRGTPRSRAPAIPPPPLPPCRASACTTSGRRAAAPRPRPGAGAGRCGSARIWPTCRAASRSRPTGPCWRRRGTGSVSCGSGDGRPPPGGRRAPGSS